MHLLIPYRRPEASIQSVGPTSQREFPCHPFTSKQIDRTVQSELGESPWFEFLNVAVSSSQTVVNRFEDIEVMVHTEDLLHMLESVLRKSTDF